MDIEELNRRIVTGAQMAFNRLLDESRQSGRKLVFSINGKIMELTADQYIALRDKANGENRMG